MITGNIIEGDALDILKTLPEESVNCCVTSPPYWGLRDYGMDEQIGIEKTPQEYVENMVNVFKEVKRVLRKDGTVWLNLGDTYNSGRDGGHPGGKKQWKPEQQKYQGRTGANVKELKPKDLVGIPWRVAFALQADGWWLRSDIIWHKPNPMPENVPDRPTRAHEYIFLLSRSQRYYYDMDAIRVPLKTKPHAPGNKSRRGILIQGEDRGSKKGASPDPSLDPDRIWGNEKGKNKRTVWKVTTKPFKGAHFATYPPKLIEPCILAGCPEGGTILDPFSGSSTTGYVAIKHGRSYIGIELNPEYIKIGRKRIDPLLKNIRQLDTFFK